jgi:uncharacterized protein
MQKILEQAVVIIKTAIPEVIAIYLFGSFGTEFATASSDLDLAILVKGKMDKVALWNLAQEIAIKINKDVDLIDLAHASTILSFQIINNDKRLYCSDNYACAMFENVVDSEYLHFKELRAGLMKDISERGRITNG